MQTSISITDERKYCVYLHQNIINNKRYFGLTCQKPVYRWGNGSTYRNNRHFYSAIQRDGWDSFTHEIIETDLTETAAKQLEQYLISKFDTTNPAFGYNITIGGESNLKYKTESARCKALREQKNKAQQKLRLDPSFQERERQYAKQYRTANKNNKSLAINNPGKRKQYAAKYLANPENYERRRAKNGESSKQHFNEVSKLRAVLKSLFNTSPEYFTEEQVMFAFGRKGHNYVTTSKKCLKEILEAVQSKLEEISN